MDLMMELIINLNPAILQITKGTFIDVAFSEGKLVFSYKNNAIDTVDANDYSKAFKIRKRLKAVIKEIIEEKGEVKVQIIRFADLHRHSGYSLLDGGSHIKDIVEKTEYVGAVTDHGYMPGELIYYKKMREKGKLPILGFEAYTESIDGNKKEAYHLILLAKNVVGFKNLSKLTSLGYGNFYYKPLLSFDMLRKYSEGIIASSACLGGEISQNILNNNYEGAKRVANEFINIFGKDDFYIEIQRHDIPEENMVNQQLIKLARELGLKIIATTDSHYTNKEDAREHEILLCIGTNKKMNDDTRFRFNGAGYHIHTPEEIEELFKDIPEALDNTLEIAEKCSGLELELNKISMPVFDVPAPFAGEAEYFEHLCWKGFEERFAGTAKFENEEYRERLQFEIDTIKRMGFPGYFLIVWDFVNFAKSNGILVGPGRGSACGSLVAYALKITEVDPIPYGLLFERFLNVDRISMPDIDLDFEDNRREEVIDYVKAKYGDDAVSRIITFGTLAARAVVRDVARVLDRPYILGDRIAKSIPAEPKMTLKKAFDVSVEFKNLYESDPEVKEIVDVAMKLEGLPRNISQHACGVIIASSAVSDFIPQILIENEKTGIKEPTTQFTMAECEEMGLLKMDFLGLRTMGVVARALADINSKRIKQGLEPIDFLSIPTDDIRIYDFISRGNTEGVFQLESPGMTAFMKELFQDVHEESTIKANKINKLITEYNCKNKNHILKIDSKVLFDKFTDLEAEIKKAGEFGEQLLREMKEYGRQLFERAIAGISLYRPGPIDEIPNYIKNMLNPEYITYETPRLEPLLKNTYGIIVYQEQCMFIVRELAGFTKGMADAVRKAMAKKKEEMLGPLGEQFIYGMTDKDGNVVIEGCIRRGISEEIAIHIWDKMKKFGAYAFNKSHAGGYAEIAIRTGWLVYYYPAEYMCATLNSFLGNAEKIKIYMAVCKKKGINILPPDVNKSREVFTVDGESIRFGLMGLKGLGKSSKDIIEERNLRGDFKGYQDFAERMAINFKIDKKILEGLAYSGALDIFPGTRRAKLSVLEKILGSASTEKKMSQSNQISLFDIATESFDEETKSKLENIKTVKIPDMTEFKKKHKLEKEKEFAGFYVTEHPLDEYVQYFVHEGVSEIGFLKEDEEVPENDDELIGNLARNNLDGQSIKIAGILIDKTLRYTKKEQKPMYTFKIEDKTDTIGCVLFSDRMEIYQDKVVEGSVVIIQGQISVSDSFGTQIIVKNIFDIETLVSNEKPKAVSIVLMNESQIQELLSVVNSNKGNLPVFFKVGANGEKHKASVGINLNYSTLTKLQEMFGSNVKVHYNT